MEILDPDLWNDDGTPKRPSKEYMASLKAAQDLEAVDSTIPAKRIAEQNEAFLNYARVKRETKAARPPEIGDIVHFWSEGTCYAAIVMETESFGHGAHVRVHVPNQPFQDWQVDHNEEKAEDGNDFSWHWPCGEGQ